MKKSRRFDGQPIRQHQKTTPPTQPDLAIEHDRREARRDLCERACGGIPDNVLKVCGVVKKRNVQYEAQCEAALAFVREFVEAFQQLWDELSKPEEDLAPWIAEFGSEARAILEMTEEEKL